METVKIKGSMLRITVCLLFVLTACDSAELETTIKEQNDRIAQLEEQMVEQVQVIEEKGDLITNYQSELLAQQEEMDLLSAQLEDGLLPYPDFRQGLIADLEENVADLTVPWLGTGRHGTSILNINRGNLGIYFMHGLANYGYVSAVVHSSDIFGPASVRFIFSWWLEFETPAYRRLSEWLAEDWEDVAHVNWEVLGYIFLGEMRLPEEVRPRHLTDLETITIRIYDVDDDTVFLWYYEEHTIQGDQLWEETLRLMPEIRDLWYDGSTLYVDLMPAVGVGGGGDSIRIMRLQSTFSSFPHVTEIRFSTAGRPGLPSLSPGLAHIFNVEARSAVPLCDLAVDEPWIADDWVEEWQNECE